ncbi:hypothetical protein ASC64_06980 [Nocardioides sp. Root122]|uniref:universal stress protein n=1 Tax=Nocardioides TaxID=1839 RepID=UPI0007037EB7|nr:MULTISPECIES: universal stress protein [Nocardioides]KQV69583.1 hypothetical protein ASC64_06980 [Nocardioides sp. Root122]MCK9824490.1 universal stress protein [Nocardioides cavernae]
MDDVEAADVVAGAVVVGVDGSPTSLAALDWAAEQARLEERRLTIVHAATVGTLAATHVDARRIIAVMHAEGRGVLRIAHERAKGHRLADVRTVLRLDDARSVLLDASRHAHLLVVGSRGRGPVASLVLGSVGVALSQHARCPVAVHRPVDGARGRAADVDGGRGVVVALDEHSGPALAWAYRHAALRRSTLTVLGEESQLAGLRGVEGLATTCGAGQTPVSVTLRAERGRIDEALLRLGRDMDVVVLGSHLRRTVLGLLDLDVVAGVVERSPCVVAVVPDRDRSPTR